MPFNIKNILKIYGFSTEKENETIYINLYNSLKKAIINRALNEKSKLPPSRVLAKDLEISRSTVIKAYELLLLEKYITSKIGSGYYVSSIKNKKIKVNLNSQITKKKYSKISKRAKSFNKHFIKTDANTNKGIAFRPGLPPLDIFPVNQWKNLLNFYWKTVKSSELSYANAIGLDSLRENIANYLKVYRNISCNVDQIIITSGSLHSLYLIGNTLLNKKDEIVIENPTYPRAYQLFGSLNAKIFATKVDKEGINIKKTKSDNPKFIYTTPSNQYPLGIKMSINRRLELLQWASSKNTFIIEDDYDHEFSNWEEPLTSIYNLDNEERIIYLGTFNKLLHPSIRLGYMIVPYQLLDSIISLHELSCRFVSPSLQKTLSLFIEKDYLNNHLRNIVEVSKERKKIFINSFQNKFENILTLENHNSGLHLISNIVKEIPDTDLANHFYNHGVITHPLSNYFINGERRNGLVLGYSSVNNKLINENLTKMFNSLNNFKTQLSN